MKQLNLKVLKENLKLINTNDQKLDKTIEKAFLELFSTSTFTVDKAKTFIKNEEKKLLENNLILHRNFEDTSSKIAKAFELSFDKNKKQIEIYQKEAEKKIKAEVSLFNSLKLKTNHALQKASNEHLEELAKTQSNYDASTKDINKEINDLKLEFGVLAKRLEDEYATKRFEQKSNYEKQLNDFNKDIVLLKEVTSEKIEKLRNELKDETKSKDLTYLTIKKTHNTSSFTLNSFITNIKNNYQNKLKTLENEYQNDINDLKIEIEDLREYHENAKELIIEQHNDKLNALNIVFDVQKQNHQKQNLAIITSYNNEVTKINSDLSATKTNINNKIATLEQEKYQKVKELKDLVEINKITKQYNREINKLNQSLINYIKTSNQKLLTAEIVFQTNLFNHDALNLKHLNEWRHIKGIYDKEREIDYQIAVKKIENDLFVLTEKEKLVNLHKKLNETIINLQLEKELLPIESQLTLASLLSNRDINLLNIEYDSFKLNNELEITILQKELQLAISKIQNELLLLKADYQYKEKLDSLTHQLNIEKNVLERNKKIETLNLNILLEQHLLDLNTTKLNNEFENYQLTEKLQLEQANEKLKYLQQTLKKEAFIEQNKRLKIIDEIKSKNQRTLNKLRNERNIKISKHEAEMHEKINLYYLDYVLNLFNMQFKSFNLLLDNIKKPVNPEITRNLLELLSDYNNYIASDFSNAIDDYLSYNKYHLNLIVTAFTKSKYQSKHEVILNNYNDSISIISSNRKNINDKINNLIQENKVIELEISGNDLKLESLKDSKDLKTINSYLRQNKNLKASFKNNEKLIKNLFKQRKPLERSILVRTKVKESEELKLERSKKREEFKYLQIIKQYESNFKVIKTTVLNFINELNNNYLTMRENPYLNDQTLNSLIKKINKLFNKNNQFIKNKFTSLLDFWLKTYLHTKYENETIINTFNLSTERALFRLNRNYEKFIKYEEKEKVELSKIHKNKLSLIKNELNHLLMTKNEKKKTNNELYNLKYNEISKKISNLSNSTANKMKLINENLHYANNEYKRELAREILNIKNNIKKEQATLNNELINTAKELKNNETRTNERAKVIINRYTNERTKFLKSMQQRRIKLQTKIDKNELSVTNSNKKYQSDLSSESIDSKYNINLLSNNLKNYRKVSNRIKKRTIRRETNDLRKNYRFKKKEIMRQEN